MTSEPTREVYRGRVVKLYIDTVQLPNGNTIALEVVRHPGASAIVALTAADEVLLVRQFRHAVGGYILEVPAGKLDGAEPPETCAVREVEEETGFRPRTLLPLGWIWTTPGFTSEKIYLFAARDLAPGRVARDPDEVITLERMPFRDALDRAARGDITDAKTIATLFRASRALTPR